MAEAFYPGQQDYIKKLNELATVNDLIDVQEGLANLDAAVSSAETSAATATARAALATTQAGYALSSQLTATTQAGISTTKAEEASNSAAAAQTSAEESEYWASQSHADQIQTDWAQTNISAIDFIRNKPVYGTAIDYDAPASGDASPSELVKGNDSRLTDARDIKLVGSTVGQVPRWDGTMWHVSNYGTAADLNVASSGDASSEQVVKGDDSRLSNPRPINLVGTTIGQTPIWDGTSWVVGIITPGLSNFTESNSITAPNNTINVAQLKANGGTTDVDIVLSPKGNGAILSCKPDNTPTGGNKRGLNAIDFQVMRVNASQVASGDQSVLIGGNDNSVPSRYAISVGGWGNTCSQQYSIVVGGQLNTSSNYYSSILGGSTNTSSGQNSTILNGYQNTVSGNYSVCLGGANALDRGVHGSLVWSGAVISNPSASVRMQKGQYLLSIVTTNTTPTVLTTDNTATVSASNNLVPPLNSSYYITIRIIAKNTGNGATASWSGKALFVKTSSDASLVRTGGSIAADYSTAGFSPALPTITANTTLGSIAVTVGGVASTNIQWLCDIETLEIST